MVKKIKRAAKKEVKKEELKKVTSPSKILGILSLCFGWLIPFVGVVLAIVGLSVKDPEKKKYRLLNLIGLAIAIILWIYSAILLLKTGGFTI